MSQVSGRHRPQKTAMLVAHRIVEDIRQAQRTTGDRLPPEHVMLEEYQVGRGTLREALRFLELQGVISLKPGPGGGPTVERPDAGTLATTLSLTLEFHHTPQRHLIEARRSLAPLITGLAAHHIDEEQLQQLDAALERMRTGNASEFPAVEREFHTIVARASGNDVHHLFFEALAMIAATTSAGEYPQQRREAVAEALGLVRSALAANDAEAAERAMTAYVQQARKHDQQHGSEDGEEPITWQL